MSVPKPTANTIKSGAWRAPSTLGWDGAARRGLALGGRSWEAVGEAIGVMGCRSGRGREVAA